MARWLALFAVLAPALALPTPNALAAPPVTNTSDSGPGSLRSSIAGAAATDTIALPPGDYPLTSGQLLVDKNLTLTGTGGDAATRIRATGPFRVICIAGAVNVTLVGVTIAGGRGAAAGACGDGQGGGIHDTGTGDLSVSQSTIDGNSATAAQGGGGGIFKETGDLTVENTTVRRNSSTATTAAGSNGGGGIRWTGSGAFRVRESEISENIATVAGPTSGGGGIYTQTTGPSVGNVTFSGNDLSVTGALDAEVGGGALYARGGGGRVDHATFTAHLTEAPGSAIASGGVLDVELINSVVHANTGPACAPGDVSSLGGNVDGGVSCAAGSADRPNADPLLGPLAENGSVNGTRTHELLARSSPAVEFSVSCLGSDQRGVGQFGGNCDSGAYEYDGRASAAVPPCSPTGNIPVNLDEPPGGDVEGLIYTLNGSAVQTLDTGPPTNGPLTTTLRIAEGRHRLVYWGQWTNGVERGRNAQNVLVDQTKPRVTVRSPAPFPVFVIKRRENVNVEAADALSGLVVDPSGRRELDTSRRGAKTFAAGASDRCTNVATTPFEYRVVAPGLGVRTVLERIKGTVRTMPAPGSAVARASQKGRAFTAVRAPREIVIRSLVDTRKGTARLTSSRTAGTEIQDSEFSGGVFQVLQSRSRRARGLTEVRLKGSSFRSCSRAKGKRASTAARRVIRRLRGRGRGRFRTRGRYSAATVRGTTWTVEDRCDGTLTRVTRGRVTVRDFRRRRTVTVRAGKSYLARAPR